MKLKRKASSTPKNRPSASLPASCKYDRHRSASSVLKQRTKPPKPFSRNLRAMEGKNYVASVIKVLGDLSGLLVVPQLSTALSIAGADRRSSTTSRRVRDSEISRAGHRSPFQTRPAGRDITAAAPNDFQPSRFDRRKLNRRWLKQYAQGGEEWLWE